MSLPNKVLLSAFRGFTEISEASLPDAAGLFYGIQTAFEERFKLPVGTLSA